MASDTDSEFNLSLEDEQLLASLVENALPKPADAYAFPHDAPSGPTSSSQVRAALVGVARTNSVNAFVHKTQPQSTPSVIPADDVKYPDRKCIVAHHGIMACTILTDLQDSSHAGLDQPGTSRSLRAARASSQ